MTEIDGPYVENEKLFDTVTKAIQTAIRVLEDALSSVSDDEYFVFLQFLQGFQLPASGYCGLGRIDGAEEAIAVAVNTSPPRKGLDLLKAALWTTTGLDGKADAADRRDDIEHLRKMLAYWRQGQGNVVNLAAE